jgi:putative membrane protein insertion efficiency factor
VVALRRRLLMAGVAGSLFLHVPVFATDEQAAVLAVRQRRMELAAAQPSRGPLDLRDSSSELEMAARVLLRLYQVLISSQDGPRCMFIPSCSEYAGLAIRRHGFLAGVLMASDRYQRCNGLNPGLYPLDPRTGKRLDPPPERSRQAGQP